LTKRGFSPKLAGMNRLTAIGLASLVAYGLLIAMKYTGVVSAANEEKSLPAALNEPAPAAHSPTVEPRAKVAVLPPPVPRAETMRLSPAALEFRQARDLKSYADGLSSRRASLSGDERYHLAKALEECQFTATISEDLAAYSAKQRRQFMAGLTAGDPLNAKRIAAYDAVDNTQRCLRFQGVKLSPKEIEDLYLAAAQQGDARAQARMLVAELNGKINSSSRTPDTNNTNTNTNQRTIGNDDFSRIIGLLETHDPEAMLIVGQFLAQSAMATQLHIGPNGEVPEPASFLGAFSLVACDMVSDCNQLNREPLFACAYGGYCSSQTFEQLYQDFIASPWAYTQAARYRNIIHTAINTRNWALIGLLPPSPAPSNIPN
jgi:hypothetical protein